jgi:hypothetical protein
LLQPSQVVEPDIAATPSAIAQLASLSFGHSRQSRPSGNTRSDVGQHQVWCEQQPGLWDEMQGAAADAGMQWSCCDVGVNFIGDGYRSLLLSDNSFNYPYLKIVAKFWHINYMVLYSQMMDINR